MRRTVFTLGLVVAACGAFGSSEDGAPVTPTRSVKCNDKACTGEDSCCLDGTGTTTCAPSCAERTFLCDDTADCSGGRVCCVDVNANDRQTAAVLGSTCRAPEECQTSSEESGPKKYRGCDPLKADCEAKDCVKLSGGVYPTVFPSSQIWVCN